MLNQHSMDVCAKELNHSRLHTLNIHVLFLIKFTNPELLYSSVFILHLLPQLSLIHVLPLSLFNCAIPVLRQCENESKRGRERETLENATYK